LDRDPKRAHIRFDEARRSLKAIELEILKGLKNCELMRAAQPSLPENKKRGHVQRAEVYGQREVELQQWLDRPVH